MLVVTRLKNESVMVGDTIEVIVFEVRMVRVRLGLCAPKQLSIHKKEEYETIQKEIISKHEPQAGNQTNSKPAGVQVVSRKIDESIMIGDDIEIMIVDIRGDSVRLGFRVPKELTVYRKEIYEDIQREKKLNTPTNENA